MNTILEPNFTLALPPPPPPQIGGPSLGERVRLLACKIFAGICAIAALGMFSFAVITASPVFIPPAILCVVGVALCIRQMHQIEENVTMRAQDQRHSMNYNLRCVGAETLIGRGSLTKEKVDEWIARPDLSWQELSLLPLSVVQKYPNIFNGDVVRQTFLTKSESLLDDQWPQMQAVVKQLKDRNEPAWLAFRDALVQQFRNKCRAHIPTVSIHECSQLLPPSSAVINSEEFFKPEERERLLTLYPLENSYQQALRSDFTTTHSTDVYESKCEESNDPIILYRQHCMEAREAYRQTYHRLPNNSESLCTCLSLQGSWAKECMTLLNQSNGLAMLVRQFSIHELIPDMISIETLQQEFEKSLMKTNDFPMALEIYETMDLAPDQQVPFREILRKHLQEQSQNLSYSKIRQKWNRLWNRLLNAGVISLVEDSLTSEKCLADEPFWPK